MRKLSLYFLTIFLVLILTGGSVFARTESGNYIIWGDVFSGGGLENTNSTNYGLQDTIGEAAILSATSTSSNYGIKAGFRELYPDQYLTFSVSATSVDLGIVVNNAASTDSHTMSIDTNATKGFAITVSGSTLTNGANTVSAIGATAAASSPGTEQFGINLAANTSPSVGANPSGTAPIGSAAGSYGTVNQFAYQSGNTVASASGDTSTTVFTVSYLANDSTGTEGGNYTTTLTYTATANF